MKIRKRKTIKASSRLARKLKDLPKIYLIGCWAHFGVRAYPFSGKCTPEGIPLVWDYRDFNGATSVYMLVELCHVTSGAVVAWTTNERAAEAIANRLEKTAIWNRQCPEDPCDKCIYKSSENTDQ